MIHELRNIRNSVSNNYRTAVTPASDLLCKEDSMLDEVQLSPTLRSSLHNKSDVGRTFCPISAALYCK